MTRLTQLLIILLCLAGYNTWAQDSYSENFDALASGAYVAQSLTPQWRTWTTTIGGNVEDANVTSFRSASPSNSFWIKNSTANGGPIDLVMLLGGTRTSGNLSMGWKVFIAQDSGAYWNIQGTASPGASFPMDFLVTTDGVLNVYASGAWSSNTIPFPIGQWVDFRLDIDLNNNLWSVYVDNVCGGIYRSSVKSAGGVDFYAVSGASYYVDDVYYNYTSDVTAYPLEAGIHNAVSNGGKQIAGEEIGFTVDLYNAGQDTIKQVEYSVTNSGNTTYDTVDVSIAAGKTLKWTLPVSVTLIDGYNNLDIQLVSINGHPDAVACNNSLKATVFAVKPADHRKVLLEEGTGTWCGWCPRGAVFLENLLPLYENEFVAVAVHNQDPMQVAAYNSVVTSFPGFTGFPGMIVDRREVQDPSTSLFPGLRYLKNEPAATITFGAQVNAVDPAKMDISVKFNFLQDITAGYQMFLTVAENEVRGTTSTYNQANYYSGGASGVMGGYENLPNPVPAAQMVYEHVGRTYDTRSNFAAYSAGDSLVANFTIAINSAWNKDNLSLVAALLDKTGAVSNVNNAALSEAVLQGFVLGSKEKVLTETKLNVYPNPATSLTTVAFTFANPSDVNLLLIDAQGRTVRQQQYSRLSGDIAIPVSLAELTPGVYTVVARTNEGIATSKLTVVK